MIRKLLLASAAIAVAGPAFAAPAPHKTHISATLPASNPFAKPILKGEQQLAIAVPPARKRRSRARSDHAPDPLFDALREARRKLAAEAGIPPYVIFHDSTLREIAARKPRDLDELAEVQGVGAVKLERYGEAMLQALSGGD